MSEGEAPQAIESDPKAATPGWTPLIAAVGLSLVCAGIPPLGLYLWGPSAGLVAAALAFGGYAWLGPRPIPGLLPGLLAMNVLVFSLSVFVASVLSLVARL